MILIDTCSILKLKLLNKEFENLFDKILNNSGISITHDVKCEVLYYYPEFEKKIEKITILSRLNTKYYNFFLQEFDKADSSLLEYGKNKNHTIITEDHKMLRTSRLMSIPSIQLCDFLFQLNKEKKIFHLKEMRKIVKYFRETKNITKRKYQKINDKINDKIKK